MMHLRARETYLSVLTPAGRGAVASVHVAGLRAAESIVAHFTGVWRGPLDTVPEGRVLFGQFGPLGEEVVLCRRGPQAWELHCHGGRAAVAMIVDALRAAGCREIAWPDWLAATADDPLRAAAHVALARAATERTAKILLDQYSGALRRAMDNLQHLIATGQRAEAETLARELLDRAPLGLHLTEPWRVVLAGRPNVGKSSLVNALVGYQRSIVFDQPGTTRDVVTAITAIDGWPVELADTAGLREGEGPVESAGIELAQAQLRAADLVVLVFDSSQSWQAEDEKLLAAWPDALRVENKIDLPPAPGSRPPALRVSAHSAETGAAAGLETLIAAIGARLVPTAPAPGVAVPFLPEHVETIRRLVS